MTTPPADLLQQLERFLGDDREGLLPCPFCGEDATTGRTREMWDDQTGYPKYGAFCTNEECRLCEGYCKHHTREEAISAWNTRAQDRALILALLEEYKQVVEAMKWYAEQKFQSDVIDVGSCDCVATYDTDTASDVANSALTRAKPVLEMMEKVK